MRHSLAVEAFLERLEVLLDVRGPARALGREVVRHAGGIELGLERGDGRGVNLARRGLDGLEPVRKLTSESTWRRVEGVEVMTTI